MTLNTEVHSLTTTVKWVKDNSALYLSHQHSFFQLTSRGEEIHQLFHLTSGDAVRDDIIIAFLHKLICPPALKS